MKDPVKVHSDQEQKINEIFGKIAQFFSPSKSKQEKLRDIEFSSKVEKYKSAKLLNPDTCDKEGTYVDLSDKKDKKDTRSKKILPKKTVRINLLPSGEIVIDGDKIIKDYSELYIENTVRGVGMGSFRKLNVRDLVCYNLNEDTYGIAWLLNPDASYIANKISGKLFANKFNQSVTFDGNWQTGKFYGRISGSQALNRLKSPNIDLNNKFNQLKDLIIKTKNNFDNKFKFEDFKQINQKIKESNNEKLKSLFSEILKFKTYLSNIEIKGMGTSSYLDSDEMKDIKSRIDKKENSDEIILDIDDLMKRFRTMDSKTEKFWDEYKNLLSGGSISPKKGKKPTF